MRAGIYIVAIIYSFLFAVTDAPVNLEAHRINSSSIYLTWSPSSSAEGYEIFHKSQNTTRESVIVSEEVTSMVLSHLADGNVEYYIFVVAFGAEDWLPSDSSNVVMVAPETGKKCVGNFLYHYDNFRVKIS